MQQVLHEPHARNDLGSACTAEAAKAATIKSAAAAAAPPPPPPDRSRRDDFMVTNYIDGTIRRAAQSTLRGGGGGGESQRSLQHLFFCCRGPLAAIHAPFNLRRHRETTLHLAGSPDRVIGVMSSRFSWVILTGLFFCRQQYELFHSTLGTRALDPMGPYNNTQKHTICQV